MGAWTNRGGFIRMSEFNLKKKREELFETMKLVIVDGVAKDIMDRIKFQDREFIRLLKDETCYMNQGYCKICKEEREINIDSNCYHCATDKLAGEKFK